MEKNKPHVLDRVQIGIVGVVLACFLTLLAAQGVMLQAGVRSQLSLVERVEGERTLALESQRQSSDDHKPALLYISRLGSQRAAEYSIVLINQQRVADFARAETVAITVQAGDQVEVASDHAALAFLVQTDRRRVQTPAPDTLFYGQNGHVFLGQVVLRRP